MNQYKISFSGCDYPEEVMISAESEENARAIFDNFIEMHRLCDNSLHTIEKVRVTLVEPHKTGLSNINGVKKEQIEVAEKSGKYVLYFSDYDANSGFIPDNMDFFMRHLKGLGPINAKIYKTYQEAYEAAMDIHSKLQGMGKCTDAKIKIFKFPDVNEITEGNEDFMK